MRLKPIHQQVVVVFGASSGIGREAAYQFARRGARVVVSARSAPGLRSLVDEIQRAGGQAIAVPADASDFAQVKAVADRAVAEFGQLDTWVHAAAVLLYATFDNTTPEEFKRVIEVNLMGQAYGAMAALPYLKREGGALIHVTSVEGQRAFPYHSAYAAAKHGIVGMVEALRVELQHAGLPISVTNIMPPSTNTPLFNKARTKIGVKPMPAPPIYQPHVIAEAILYAAENPVRDIAVGGAGKGIVWTQQLSPRLMDAMLERVGFEAQQTDEPKSEHAPDNLYGPIQGYDRVEGDFSDQALQHSFANWTDRHSNARTLITGAAIGALAMWLARSSRNQE